MNFAVPFFPTGSSPTRAFLPLPYRFPFILAILPRLTGGFDGEHSLPVWVGTTFAVRTLDWRTGVRWDIHQSPSHVEQALLTVGPISACRTLRFLSTLLLFAVGTSAAHRPPTAEYATPSSQHTLRTLHVACACYLLQPVPRLRLGLLRWCHSPNPRHLTASDQYLVTVRTVLRRLLCLPHVLRSCGMGARARNRATRRLPALLPFGRPLSSLRYRFYPFLSIVLQPRAALGLHLPF